MVGVVHARLQERNPAVKLHARNVEGVLGDAEQVPALPVEYALVRDVVDREDRRHARPVPAQIGGCEPSRPVVDVQQVRRPGESAAAFGELSRSKRESREAQVVVRPVESLRTAIRGSRALIKRWREHQVHDQTVR